MAKLLRALFLVLLAVSAFPAQQVAFQKKYVVVNEWAFYDEKTGITKLVNAERICGNIGFISERDEQKRKEIYERSYAFRRKQIVEPILREIAEALSKIESENNLVVLLVGDMAEKEQLLGISQNFEITRQFIGFFNKKSVTTTEALKLNIPDGKIVSINTQLFFDKNLGIKRVTNAIDANGYTTDNVCQKTSLCSDVGKAVQTFIDSKGYSLIFDSSRKLPDAVKDVAVEDVTKDFISYFNSK